ncbi:hypothetical protein KKF38_01855 [Patescibacteria group bacterium]|nr:hypothetical protein [Patescibacteria group bacterium]
MKNEFSKLQEFLERLRNRLFLAYSHFQIWEALREMRAPNKIKKKQAEKNVKTMNRFNSFFGPTAESHRRIFAIELFKFFDFDERALSIIEIKKFARINLEKLTVKEFKEFNSEREHLGNLVKNYEGIQNKDLRECERLLLKNGLNIKEKRIEKESSIWRLKKFRNQDLAHDQIKKEKIPLSVCEIETLFHLVEKILNLLSHKLNHDLMCRIKTNDNVKRHTKCVVEYLQRFELYRLKEIREDHERELKMIEKITPTPHPIV